MTRFVLPLALLGLVSVTGCRHHYHYEPQGYVYLQTQKAPATEPASEPIVVEAAPVEKIPFDRDAAAKALAAVDLDDCRRDDEGRTTVHATLTYEPTGNVSRVTIDRPAGLPVKTVACIGQKLGGARVPSFDGNAVLVSRSFPLR